MAEKESAKKSGLNRCPHCGGSDIATDTKEGKLRCKYCKTLFDAKSGNEAGGVEELTGETRGVGSGDIVPGDDIVHTFKCPSCGSEVVVNTDEATSAVCHWCRHFFSVNEKISNGAVPDLVLPFKITKEEAVEKIRGVVDLENKDLLDEFRSDFNPERVQGVYFPYMIVDVRAHSSMEGTVEHYADEVHDKPPYKVYREVMTRSFDLLVDDLTVESSASRLNQNTYVNSNNIINAILPFDTENAVLWDANYLRGFASEKRSVNVDELKQVVALQCGDIARVMVNETVPDSERGIHWHKEHLGIKGTKWRTAYLPVWLYSYRRDGDSRIYYVAVNARTGESVGCIPAKGRQGLNIEARHHHEIETHAKLARVEKETLSKGRVFKSRANEMPDRNDQRVIGSLSHGREQMLGIERARFGESKWDNGPKRRYAPTHRSIGEKIAIAIVYIIMGIFILAVLFAPQDYGPGKARVRSSSSSSSSSSDYGGSSYDSGSSYSSGGSSDSGFDYSYDY